MAHVRAGVIGALIAAVATLAACSSSTGTANGTSDGADHSGSTTTNNTGTGATTDKNIINVAFTDSPATLDPAMACTTADMYLVTTMYTQLVSFKHQDGPGGTTTIDPANVDSYLAKSWDVSDDQKEYTFHLNSGWKFPDGTPQDAAAVKFSLDRATAMGGCGGTIVNDLYSDPNLIDKVTVVNPTTVKVSLTRPDGMFLEAMATPAASIVNPTLVNANGGVKDATVNKWMAAHDAGGGPYVLDSYVSGTSAVLKRNKDFQGETGAGADEINVSLSVSAATATLNAQNQTADVTFGLPNATIAKIESQSGANDPRVVKYNATMTMQMIMPNDKEPWTNKDVRKAVVLAIPYEDIVKNVLNGNGKLYYGPIPPSMPGFSEKESQPIKTNLDEAKSLIKDSGVQTPIKVTLDVISGNPIQKQLATILQSTLQGIGIDITVRSLDASAYNDAIYGGKSQAALRLDGPAIINPGYYLQYDMTCGLEFNTGRICIKENDALLKQARATSDQQKQQDLYAQITKNWVADYPRVDLYQDITSVVLSQAMTKFYYSDMLDMSTWSKG